MDLGLAGSTAVVTGGSKGMGLAVAETLAAEGAKVAVMARGRHALDAAVALLREAQPAPPLCHCGETVGDRLRIRHVHADAHRIGSAREQPCPHHRAR